MPRIYLLVAIILSQILTTLGQGVGDFALLSDGVDSYSESTFLQFIEAARSDGDSTKAVLAEALYGRFLTHQQRYPEARNQLMLAFQNMEELKGTLHKTLPLADISIYDTYDYLGEFYTATANYKNAAFLLKQSEEIRRQNFARGSIHRIFNIQKLAQFYIDTDQNTLAEAYLTKLILELNRTRFNSQKLKSAYATYYKGMTEVCIREGRLEEARRFLKKTFVFYGSPFTSYAGAIKRSEGNAEMLQLRSRVLMMEDRPGEALKLMDMALDRNPGPTNLLPRLLRYKAICLLALNREDEALAVATHLLQIHLDNLARTFPSLSENEKEAFNNRVHYDFDLFNSLVISSAGKKALDTVTLHTLINFRLETKALLLNSSRKLRETIMSSGDTSLIKDFHKLSMLKNAASVEVFRKKSRAKLDLLNHQMDSLEKSVDDRMAVFAKADRPQVKISEIQRRLKPDECAIEIIQTRKFRKTRHETAEVYNFNDSTSYLMVMIYPASIQYAILQNGTELDTRMASLFKNSVRLEDANIQLYNAYWQPLDISLANTHTAYISADGIYNLINLNLLRNENGYLLDQLQIVLLTNLKDIVDRPFSSDIKSAVFVGHPQYEQVTGPAPSSPSVSRALRSEVLEDLPSETFSDLPGTEAEVVASASILSDAGWRVREITGPEASEHRVKEIQDPTLLHLATHGFFIAGDWGVNPMLRSGLILAGVKNIEMTYGEDGILTAYEACNLTLDSTQLVVLSACETGNGEVKSGEGVYGLQRAFMIAGARNVIMSLWKVDDTATQKLMQYFYQSLAQGIPVRQSFTRAQQTLRNEYPEPFYWGAFIMLGL